MGKDTGGPAFPILNPNIGYHADIQKIEAGLTLRDYFAGQVLASMFSNGWPKGIDADYLRQVGAKYAYAVADAMLEARK